MEANFIKLTGGHLVPASDQDKAIIDKIKVGQVLKFTFTRMRNYKFHKKWFALVGLAFDYWEPTALPDDPEKKWMKRVTPEKNFDRFRKDITIRAGHYDAYYRLDGSVRIEAKSISFGDMSEETFEKLYSDTINVVLKQIYKNYTEDDLNSLVAQVMSFS